MEQVGGGAGPAGRGAGPAGRGAVLRGRGAVLRGRGVAEQRRGPAGPGAGPDLLTAWRADPDSVLSSARRAGAAILVAAPGDFTADAISGERAASVMAACGILAVISPGYGEIFCVMVANSGVLPICLPIGQVVELQDIIDADQQTLITVDQGRHEVTAGDEFSAALVVAVPAGPELPGGHAGAGPAIPGDSEITGRRTGGQAGLPASGSAWLADRIRAAQHRIATIDMPSDVRVHFQNRLVAVCDAMKAATADTARCEQRLAALTADLDRLTAAREPGIPPDYNS
jgi:hypothetical protein